MNYKVGQKETLYHTLTIADIEKFSELSGDRNPIHFELHGEKNITCQSRLHLEC